MHTKKVLFFVTLLSLVSLLLGACATQEVIKTVVVEKEKVVTEVVKEVVVETEIVEVEGATQVVEKRVEVVVTPTPEPTQPPAAPVSPAQRADVIRMAMLSDIDGLNPWYYNDITGSSYWNAVILQFAYPTLFTLSDQRWDWAPFVADGLPETPVQEGDLWVGTVRLKPGLTWSDGSPLTAQDVAFTANTALTFAFAGNWVGWYNPALMDRAEVVDDLTVKFYYKVTPGLAIWQYGTLVGPFVNKAYWEPKIADILAQAEALDPTAADFLDKVTPLQQAVEAIPNDNEPYFGPIKFKRWEPGAYVESEANDQYAFIGTREEEFVNGAYRESNSGELNQNRPYDFTLYGEASGDKALDLTYGPYFQTFLFPVYSQDAAYLALQNGEVDIVLNPSGVSQGIVDQLKANPDVQIVRNAQNGFRYIEFNQARPFFKDAQGLAMRQAIACQIDLDFLTQNVLQRQVEPVYTLVPAGLTYWHNPDVPVYCKGMTPDQRINEAVRILKEAGFTWDVEPSYTVGSAFDSGVTYGEGLKLPDGTAFPEITLQAPGPGYDPLRATSAVYIEQWMRQLGIPLTLNYTPFNTIRANENSGDFDIIMLGWGLSAFPSYLCDFFTGATGVGDGSDNIAYVSPKLNEACNRWYQESDMVKAKDLAFEMQNILATELPYITLFSPPITDAYLNTIQFPYTDVFDGLQGLYSSAYMVMPSSQ